MAVLISVGLKFFTISIFFGSMRRPSRLTTWPRYSALVAKRTHLLAFIERPAHLSRWKTASIRVNICSKELASRSSGVEPLPVLQTPISSRYGMQDSQARPCRAASIRRTM